MLTIIGQIVSRTAASACTRENRLAKIQNEQARLIILYECGREQKRSSFDPFSSLDANKTSFRINVRNKYEYTPKL